ncbi:MAG: hypothetical protein ACE5F2_02910 [Candidatus Paceibacteria bacterium]
MKKTELCIKEGKLMELVLADKELSEKIKCIQKFYKERKKWERALFTSKTVLNAMCSEHMAFLC